MTRGTYMYMHVHTCTYMVVYETETCAFPKSSIITICPLCFEQTISHCKNIAPSV